jgi:hypothetical protein
MQRGYVTFKVLIAVAMKSSVFWEISPCSPVKVKRRFRDKLYLHLKKIKQFMKLLISKSSTERNCLFPITSRVILHQIQPLV